MPKRLKKALIIGVLLVSLLIGIDDIINVGHVGRPLDAYRGVPVYDNGPDYSRSYGENYSADGYYYGEKWQCVEYIKRFYFDALHHRMPDGMGNAKDFYDPEVAQAGLNRRRGLLQYANGGNEAPQPDDVLVFRDSSFGHVAIISAVTADHVEVIQQNVLGHTRANFALISKEGSFVITTPRSPAGWLRIPPQ